MNARIVIYQTCPCVNESNLLALKVEAPFVYIYRVYGVLCQIMRPDIKIFGNKVII